MQSQFKVQHIVQGKGSVPPKGATAQVHYTGILPNGDIFDSSEKRGEPFVFRVGMGEVIKGWDEGFLQLKVGGKAILTCPPSHAYGPQGIPGAIPPNATLIFFVELLGYK